MLELQTSFLLAIFILFASAQTPQQLNNYEFTLTTILSQIQIQISQADNVTRQAQSLFKTVSQQNIQQSLLQEADNQIRQKLMMGIATAKLPLYLKTWNCSNLTQQNQDTVNRNIDLAKQYQIKINQLIINQSACQKTQQLVQLNQLLMVEVANLQNEQKSNCATLNPNGINNKNTSSNNITNPTNNNSNTTLPVKNNNPNAQNFIGILPPNNINAPTCPLLTPFYNNKACIACSLPNYFDLNQLLCLTCPDTLAFDISTKSCSAVKKVNFNSNIPSSVQNYIGTPPSSNNAISTCSSDSPFFNGNNCLSCMLPSYFDFNTLQCKTCQPNYIFSNSKKTCEVDSTKVYYISLTAKNNYIGNPPNTPSDTLTSVCPLEKPYSSRNICQACDLPNFFNFLTNNCEVCSNDMTFSIESRTCISKSTNSSFQNSNINTVTNFMYQIPSYQTTATTCPTQTPFFNGKSCISCTLPLYFNFRTFTCEKCPSNTSFNVNNRMCEFLSPNFLTDLTNSNIYYNGNFTALQSSYNSSKSANPSLQTCPQDHPFFDATKNICISCPYDASLFNLKYNQCMNCPSDSYFDTFSRICIYNQIVKPSFERTLMNSF